MKRSTVIILAVIIVAAVAAYRISSSVSKRPITAAPAHTDEAHHEDEHAEIEGLKLEPAVAGDSWDIVSATGKVGPNMNNVIKVSPRIAGKVVSIKVNVGDNVARGQTLAVISSVELAAARAEYRQAAARLKAAEQAYDNQVRLAKLGAFSNRPVEEARSEHIEAQGELAQAKSELAQSQSELVRAESELVKCEAKLERAKDLYKDQIISKQDLEEAESEYRRDLADVEVAKSKIRQAKSKIEQLEARADIAFRYLDREQKIQKNNLLSTKELQAAKAQVTEARLQLQATADAIRVLGASPGGSGDTLTVTSPISGRVVERNTSLGEMVDPSGTLFTVMNLSDVWVEANVYEKDLDKVKTGQTAEIRVNGSPDKVYTGKVAHVSDVLDPETRTAKVRCAVSNADGALKPEMFASVNIITGSRSGAVLIPKQAVLDDAGKKIVFVACSDCPEDKAPGGGCGEYDRLEVEAGPVHGGKIEILRGLNPGQEVVVEGQYQLKTSLGSGELHAGCADGH